MVFAPSASCVASLAGSAAFAAERVAWPRWYSVTRDAQVGRFIHFVLCPEDLHRQPFDRVFCHLLNPYFSQRPLAERTIAAVRHCGSLSAYHRRIALTRKLMCAGHMIPARGTSFENKGRKEVERIGLVDSPDGHSAHYPQQMGSADEIASPAGRRLLR